MNPSAEPNIRATGLSGLLGVLLLLLLDLIHRCRHAIVGQPIDDLGVGEHDGFAIGKRDFVVRGLGAVRIVGAKHNMRDHTCPSIFQSWYPDHF